jgi:hypothetical protein
MINLLNFQQRTPDKAMQETVERQTVPPRIRGFNKQCMILQTDSCTPSVSIFRNYAPGIYMAQYIVDTRAPISFDSITCLVELVCKLSQSQLRLAHV